MKVIFISELADKGFIEHMKGLGTVILVPGDPRLDPRISSHPDLVVTIVDNNLIIDEGASPRLFAQLDALELPYVRSSQPLKNEYPYDIAYNAVVTKYHLIHNLAYTNPLILQHCKNSGKTLVNVKQGYGKCSTVLLDDRHLISSDSGICRSVRDLADISILPVQPGFVELEGFDYGFLGGCSGVIDDTVVFHGDLSRHSDFHKIKEFIKAAGKKLLYFTDFPLRDIGSILVYQADDTKSKGSETTEYKKHVNIPIFISHEGCPNDCVFCNQRKITAKTQAMSIDEVKEQIKSYCSTLDQETFTELAFFGGSFTGIAASLQESYLSLAYEYKQAGTIHAIRLSTRPDYISTEILERLKKYSVDIIELGVQSLDDNILAATKRGHQVSDVYKAVNLIKTYGFGLGIQLMVGLPGDTKETAVQSARLAALLQPDFVRIYPTLVIRETELASLSLCGEYSPLSLDTAVDWTREMYQVFLDSHIAVIRMGLQPTELIAEGKEVLYGPFHPAFRQLVESEYFYDLIKKELSLQKDKLPACSRIKIICNPADLSQVIGHKRKNIIRLEKEYGIMKMQMQIITDSRIKPLTLELISE